METKSVAERHYKVLMAGVDQFGGNNDRDLCSMLPYRSGKQGKNDAATYADFRPPFIDQYLPYRFVREPYLDPAHTSEVVGCPEFMQEGYDAQV